MLLRGVAPQSWPIPSPLTVLLRQVLQDLSRIVDLMSSRAVSMPLLKMMLLTQTRLCYISICDAVLEILDSGGALPTGLSGVSSSACTGNSSAAALLRKVKGGPANFMSDLNDAAAMLCRFETRIQEVTCYLNIFNQRGTIDPYPLRLCLVGLQMRESDMTLKETSEVSTFSL